MDHNLRLGPDADATNALAMLRGAAFDKPLDGDPLVPGVFLVPDPAAQMTGTVASEDGTLLRLRTEVQTPGAWFGLHVSLGGIDLDRSALVGFACKTRAPATILSRACLRSGEAEGFSDAFFDKHIVSYEAPGLHLDVMEIAPTPALPPHAPWRELILFFPTGSFEIELLDLRLFIL